MALASTVESMTNRHDMVAPVRDAQFLRNEAMARAGSHPATASDQPNEGMARAMSEAKRTYRSVETNVKKTARGLDGTSLKDRVGNAGDEVREGLGNLGDDVRAADQERAKGTTKAKPG